MSFFISKKFILIGLILWGMMSCSFFFAYKFEWTMAMNQPRIIDEEGTSDDFSGADLIVLNNDDYIVQTIENRGEKLTGISLYIDATEANKDTSLLVTVMGQNENKLTESSQFDFSERRDAGYYDIIFDKEIDVENEDNLYICISVKELYDSQIQLCLISSDNPNTKCEINGNVTKDGIIPYKVFGGTYIVLKYFVIALYIFLTLLLVGVCALLFHRKRIEIVFGYAAFVIGIIYMFILPPFVVPDEASHFVTAYAESSELMGVPTYNEKGEILVTSEELFDKTGKRRDVSKELYSQFFEGVLGEKEYEEELVATRNPLSQEHPGYIPSVLGISLARIMNMNSEQILFMGRFFALSWYVLIMYCAIKIMPIKKEMLFLVGLLPITIQQVVSYNYDSFLLGICFFAIAYILNLIYTDRKIKIYDWIIVIGIVISIASIKFVYLPILGLALFIPKEKFGNRFRKTIGSVSIVLVAIFVMFYSRLLDYGKTYIASTQDMTEPTKYTIAYCIDNPVSVLGIFFRTIERQSSKLLSEMMGTFLGYLNISIPQIFAFATLILLLLSIMNKSSEKNSTCKIKWYLALCCIIVSVCLMVVMFFDWTLFGNSQIEGIQGRYFLPILPLALLFFENNVIISKKDFSREIIVIMCYIHCMVAFFVSLDAIT